MNGSYGVRGTSVRTGRPTVRPTAGRPPVRTAPLVVIGVFLACVVLVGVIAFLHGA